MEGGWPFMPAWCLICAALLACLSPAPPTKSLDLSLTLTNNVIHVNDVPEHLLTMYPVCTLPRVRRWMSRRFFLLFLRTRFVTFAEGFPWTCETGSPKRVPTIAFRRIARERVLPIATSSVNQIGTLRL